jgi:hypothetical protein
MPRFRIAPVKFASEDLAGRKGRTCRPGAPRRAHTPPIVAKYRRHTRRTHLSPSSAATSSPGIFARQRVSMGRARRDLLCHCVCALLVKHKPVQARAAPPARAAAAPGRDANDTTGAFSEARANSAGAGATRYCSAPPKCKAAFTSLPPHWSAGGSKPT